MTAPTIAPPAAVLGAAAALLADVDFKNTITTGSAIIALLLGAVGGWFALQMRTALQAAQGASDAWKDERDAEVAKAERLTDMLEDERERHAEALATVAKLQERTDLTQLRGEVITAFQSHEEGARGRHAEILPLLQRLADCGPTIADIAERDGNPTR